MSTAHTLNEKERTEDILSDLATDFESLLLSPKVIQGLRHAGFIRPSPIQLQAIPYAKCGVDLICQAKSGTGKTCVFTVSALELVDITNPSTQVLVLAPTREIAHQINEVIINIGCMIPELNCGLFIGGVPVDENIKALTSCHIATGSPGRIKYLIERGNLSTEFIRLFILDEADKLLEEGKGSFQEQINWIYSTLPKDKQVLALSATYPESLAAHLANYMEDPIYVRINKGELTLKGVKQYVSKTMFHPYPVKAFEEKCLRLIEIIKILPFQQCMVFSNFQSRAENLSKRLCREGWPCTFISGSQLQAARRQAMDQLKKYYCRVLLTTDLTARGIDCDKVDLVINLDLPWETETYLHRVGRAGRFGSLGIAISIVSEGKEVKKIESISKEVNVEIHQLPLDIKDVWLQDKMLLSEVKAIDTVINETDKKEKESIVRGIIDSFVDDVFRICDDKRLSSLSSNDFEQIKGVSNKDSSISIVTSKCSEPIRKLPKYLAISHKMRKKRNKLVKTDEKIADYHEEVVTASIECVLSTCLNSDLELKSSTDKDDYDENKQEITFFQESSWKTDDIDLSSLQLSSHNNNFACKKDIVSFNPMALNLDLMKLSSNYIFSSSSNDHESTSNTSTRQEVENNNHFNESTIYQTDSNREHAFQLKSRMIYNENELEELHNSVEINKGEENLDLDYSSYSETSSNLENSTELEMSFQEVSSISVNSWKLYDSKYPLQSSKDGGYKSYEFESKFHTKRKIWNHQLFQNFYYKAYYNQVSTIQNCSYYCE